jgi:hypothetical protein
MSLAFVRNPPIANGRTQGISCRSEASHRAVPRLQTQWGTPIRSVPLSGFAGNQGQTIDVKQRTVGLGAKKGKRHRRYVRCLHLLELQTTDQCGAQSLCLRAPSYISNKPGPHTRAKADGDPYLGRRRARCCISANSLRSSSASFHFAFGTTLTLSAVGKLSGNGSVTAPVAAHSVPRCNVAWKPTHSIAFTSWPIGV